MGESRRILSTGKTSPPSAPTRFITRKMRKGLLTSMVYRSRYKRCCKEGSHRVAPAGRKPALHTSGGPGRQLCGDPGPISDYGSRLTTCRDDVKGTIKI